MKIPSPAVPFHRLVPIAVLVAGVALAATAPAGKDATKPGSAAPASSAAEAPRIHLRWTTSTEVDNYGFLVFRAEAADGPFREVTPKVIAGAGNSEVPRDYAWEDRDVVPGRDYWYYLESITSSGIRERFSPVISRTCCRPPAPPASAGSTAAAPPSSASSGAPPTP